ncbi:MAG: VWA domain-containing protein [Firmicutes bacterium]|nr:VWA domain-containing protein [Bacillota bacterium]
MTTDLFGAEAVEALRLRRRLPGFDADVRELARTLAAGRGGRLGESAVVSPCVHLLDARRPDEVTVVQNRDAGQVFYGRQRPREVVHIDIFHEVGEVDHRRAAACLRAADRAWRLDHGEAAPDLLDFVDIQTGTGGGRVTGSLTHGRRSTVRLAHLNHVHLAALLPGEARSLVPYLVAAVERAIAAQGLEVRAVARVRHRLAPEGAAGQDDLAPYADVTDTLLRQGVQRRGAPWEEELFSMAVGAARAAGGAQAAAAAFDRLAQGPRLLELVHGRPWDAVAAPGFDRAMLDRWMQEGWVARRGDRLELTEEGRALRRFLQLHLSEVDAALRAAARRIQGARKVGRRAWERAGRGPRARVERLLAAEPWSELAVAETVAAAARRAPGAPRVEAGDLHVRRREQLRPLDLVLLIDASASMAGARIRAAQDLVRHLLATSRDRVAVISFQDREAQLQVPLTRNYASVERGLRAVRPSGLTPLATALETARAYLAAARPRRPLLLLITDGIPTVSRSPLGPLEDALQAADEVARARLPFSCVGLEPNRGYLAELARRAGGTLYVVEELHEATLIEIAQREQRRHRPRSRTV